MSTAAATTPKLPKRDRSAPARPTQSKSIDQQRSTSSNQTNTQSHDQTGNVTSSTLMPKINQSPVKQPNEQSKFSSSQPLPDSLILDNQPTRASSHSMSAIKSNGSYQTNNQPRDQSTDQSPDDAESNESTPLKKQSTNQPNDQTTATNQTLTAKARALAHQEAMLETLRELVRSHNVGHWKGLNTNQRKEVAISLCKEHLFNPQPAKGKDSRTVVHWSAQSSMIDYDIWVTCVKRVEPFYQGKVFIVTYSAHFDQSGRLVEFDEKRNETVKNCSIM